ncbi:MAG TPA: methylated-DNA--[protein]-cysteine S-methyltransferase [Saprospiraceae bacterium]|jgi:methylated-DNA-[protein]-cysteine S-methyltransferase|nr:methylated-DNA--[protein]-cysteine S-methyltransferase [Candidatus Parvibacillus calidus]MBX2935831.1 methylated-DNA--[protein]-cysteine S-methyltransferase [Saprospiraceae bacterium]MBX7178396.1 methylated-DNA--[protein]-cysteine S-methyltransferase [Saprospiraceae bacterium]MCB0591414.1 methylated-DNA--[protein]-cysteine S-methyltransferase [Saprospiraceae bacterium]MCO5283671.1 methylated-DNA--[protein]-cysteine S-methyltransferase [Saprospiraceae bacterium]
MGTYCDLYNSPVGQFLLEASDRGILSCDFIDDMVDRPSSYLPNIHTIRAAEWLDAYFSKQPLPKLDYDLSGTDFQLKVWDTIDQIPYGQTISYNDIVKNIPGTSARAVGTATGRNPLAIIIPCHRVIGSDGKLHGYSGGIKRKIWLLAFEKEDSLFLPDVQ